MEWQAPRRAGRKDRRRERKDYSNHRRALPELHFRREESGVSLVARTRTPSCDGFNELIEIYIH